MLLAGAGCPGRIARPYPPPSGADVAEKVKRRTQGIPSLKAETRTDVRVGKDRANVSVLIRAVPDGGKLRFQAMNPNDSLAADLASDGNEFCFLDTRSNCGDCGHATPENVARLIRIPLEPEQVADVLLGSAPLLDDENPTVTWDDREGHEILTLQTEGWKQRVVLDGRDQRWDLLEAELHGPDGKLVWRVRHKDFHPVKTPDGEIRLPGASLFEQEGDKVKIDWREQVIEAVPDDAKFRLELPDGLAQCGEPVK